MWIGLLVYIGRNEGGKWLEYIPATQTNLCPTAEQAAREGKRMIDNGSCRGDYTILLAEIAPSYSSRTNHHRLRTTESIGT